MQLEFPDMGKNCLQSKGYARIDVIYRTVYIHVELFLFHAVVSLAHTGSESNLPKMVDLGRAYPGHNV